MAADLEMREEPAGSAPEVATARPPIRVVFSLLHAGYLRHYAEPIRILADRGHSIHVAVYRSEVWETDQRLLHRLVEECPSVTWSASPRRRHTDGWRGLAWLVRGLIDVLRYADPRYSESPALRARAIEKVRVRVGSSRADLLTRVLVRVFLDRIADTGGNRALRRLRWLLAIERAIPASRRVNRLLLSYRADAVLASPVVEIGSPQVEFIKSAQRLKIPCAVAVASWDNLTSKGLLRIVPDRVIVWNEIQRRELEQMHDIPPERVVVTGGQKFDGWFERRPETSQQEFARKVGLDPIEYVLYLCSSAFIAPDEVEFVRRWVGALRSSEDARVRALGVLVRPHPQNAKAWIEADLSEFTNVVVWPRGGAHPDAGDAQADFFDSMAHSVAVVGVNTSAQIDAAIVGKPVYTIRDAAFSASQDGTIHFRYLLEEQGGFVRSADSLEEHCAQLASGLADPASTRARLESFVASFVRPRGLELPVAPIVADEIEALARIVPDPQRRPSSIALRALLSPLVLTMSALASPVAVLHRLHRAAARKSVATPDQELARR